MREKKIVSPKEVDEMIERKLRELKLIEGLVEPREIEEELKHHPKPHKKLPHHEKLLPHEHEALRLDLHLEEKIDLLIEIFGDESTAHAVIKTFNKSPLEIQLIAKMVIDLHDKFNDILGE